MRYLLTLGLLLWAGAASAFTINGKTYSTWNGKTLATWNGVTAAAPSNALVPASNTGFESGVLSPWVDTSLNGGGGASSSASVISTAELTGSKALQLAGTGGNDYDSNAESGGPTDGEASAKYTFPIAAIDSTHKTITFDVKPKVIHAAGFGSGGYEFTIAIKVFNGATLISDLSWPVSGISVFAYPATIAYGGGSFLIPTPAVDTTYTVQADILAKAQGALLSGHTWGEATSVEVKLAVIASGAVSDGAGSVTDNSLLTVLVDNFR